jgi:hypothetical protein
MPVALNEAIIQMAQLGQQKTQSDMAETKQLVETVKRSNQQVIVSIIGSALLIGAVLNNGLSRSSGLDLFSGLVGGFGLLLLGYALLKRQ